MKYKNKSRKNKKYSFRSKCAYKGSHYVIDTKRDLGSRKHPRGVYRCAIGSEGAYWRMVGLPPNSREGIKTPK